MEDEDPGVEEEASFEGSAANYRVTRCSFSPNVASSEKLEVACHFGRAKDHISRLAEFQVYE